MLTRIRIGIERRQTTMRILAVGVLWMGGATAIAGSQQVPAGPVPSSSARDGSQWAVAPPAPTAPVVRPPLRYRMQRGDSLEVTFPFAPTFNQSMVVQPDGFIHLRAVGDQRAEGLTVSELSEAVHERYTSILRDPVVSIELKDFERPYFVAAGEVERPGKYELRGDTTLRQALAVAGGFKENAKRTNVVVFRRSLEGEPDKVQEVNVQRLLDGSQRAADVSLESGDLVFVSKSRSPNLTTLASILSSLGWLTVMLR